MKNANIVDVHKLIYGDDMSNVMFLVKHPTFGKIKAHPVKNGQWSEGCGVVGHVMETTSGEKFIAEYEWIHQIPRKLGTPAKPKRKPQKGTKPELANAVPYDFSLITDGCKVLTANGKIYPIDFSNRKDTWDYYYLNAFDHGTGKNKYHSEYDIKKIILDVVAYNPKLIAPGVRVLCRDGKVRTVDHVKYNVVEFTENCFSKGYVSGVELESGMANYIINIPHPSDIMKILVGKQQATPSVKQESKPKYEKGVWNVWFGGENPASNRKVNYIMRDAKGEEASYTDPADNLRWDWIGGRSGTDIIAFKIVE